MTNQHRLLTFTTTAGANQLHGTLWLPDGQGPHPTIIMLSGSGASDRDNNGYFVPIRQHFVSNGIAVFGYDKPGVRESSGDWQTQSFDGRVQNCLDAITCLRQQSDVDNRRIGLWGHSQGGYFAPLVATVSPHLRCIVINSGPSISVKAQMRFDLEQQSRARSYSEEVIIDVLQRFEKMAALLEIGAEFSEWQRIEPDGMPGAWTDNFGELDKADWDHTRLIFNYNPQPFIGALRIPLLVMLGADDKLVPAVECATIYRQLLTESGNEDFEIKVIENANHRMKDADGHFISGYLETMTEWLLRHL